MEQLMSKGVVPQMAQGLKLWVTVVVRFQTVLTSHFRLTFSVLEAVNFDGAFACVKMSM